MTTSPLCLVTFSSEMKHCGGDMNRLGWQRRAPGLKGLYLCCGCCPGVTDMHWGTSTAQHRGESEWLPLHHLGASIGWCKMDLMGTFLGSVIDSNINYHQRTKLNFESYQHRLRDKKYIFFNEKQQIMGTWCLSARDGRKLKCAEHAQIAI